MYNLELFPPEYWTHYTSSKSVKKWKSEKSASEQYYQLVELEATDNVYQAIENLVQNTWEASKVGHGQDAKGAFVPWKRKTSLTSGKICSSSSG
jgi:hypothetical protein